MQCRDICHRNFLRSFKEKCVSYLKKEIKNLCKDYGIVMPNYIQPVQLGKASCWWWTGWSLHYHSLIRNSDGGWNVPYTNWNGSDWNRNANRLDNTWNQNYRVVLLVTFYFFQTVRRLFPNRFGSAFLLGFSSHITSVQFLPFLGRSH